MVGLDLKLEVLVYLGLDPYDFVPVRDGSFLHNSLKRSLLLL